MKTILFGGDYNPEQWPEEIWEEDMRLFALSHVNTLTLNVFSWASLQKDEDTYCFERLDRIMNLVREHGIKVCLATSTAAHPAWMAKKYPDVLRTEFDGSKRKFGSRHNSCPNSKTYRSYGVKLAGLLAKRYGTYDNIVGWHIGNEYGGACYCENCEKAFRLWLKDRYGTIEEVNRVWNTAFWGHTFYEFEEVVAPNLLSEHFAENRTTFQGISLDYSRFNSESMLACFIGEYKAIKEVLPQADITTNLMGFYKPLDYQKWAEHMDFISWDNYPANDDPYTRTAMSHDLMRGLKGGKPFVLMEQTPSVTNWLAYNALKRPGVMRLLSYQAMAHGADAVLFFQMRRSIGACEKFHGALIDHAGHENTRVFREMEALGRELSMLQDKTLGMRTHARVAILFDWENWWALEYSAGPSCELAYLDEVYRYYGALANLKYQVDFVSKKDDLSGYALVIAPLLYMTPNGLDDKLKAYVKEGGTFITTFFSGIVDENDLVITGGYPGRLRELLGIWVEEIDALPAVSKNYFTYEGVTYKAKLLCDIMHLEGAESLAEYGTDFYQKTPVLTKHKYGQGQAFYVGTRSEEAFYEHFLKERLKEQGIDPLCEAPLEVEVCERYANDCRILYVLNHSDKAQTITAKKACTELLTGKTVSKGSTMQLMPKGVMLLAYE